ncbi:hypothetical protein BDZ45DRAFT_684400 [Acephala macrosclerotiorum]|nr:hypothetical protein BDZ45DRAFT_684400 [Acephala macrosclerotiorum]
MNRQLYTNNKEERKASNASKTTISLSSPTLKNPKHKYLIFFTPGNPGLVEYYRTFLTHLHTLLSSQTASQRLKECEIEIVGETLAGFECDDNPPRISEYESLPFGVEDQIQFAERLLVGHLKRLTAEKEDDVGWRVLMVGHSFGSYVSLEIIRRFRAICLFPGILNLAESLRAKELVGIPLVVPIGLTISFLLRWITYLLPTTFLAFLLNRFVELPKDAASTTAYFLRSKWGLEQALYMAQDELLVIVDNKWNSEIWGAATPTPLSQSRPKLFILFGKDDQWMSNQVRDELIKEKGWRWDSEEEMWKPVMEIEETGIPHDFCIRGGVKVAERVVGWVRDVIVADIGEKELG